MSVVGEPFSKVFIDCVSPLAKTKKGNEFLLTNFVSGVFQEVMCELDISQVVSSSYHPQSQGVLERAHQTLKTMLKTYSAQFHGDWDVALSFLLFALRDSVSEATGFTPLRWCLDMR